MCLELHRGGALNYSLYASPSFEVAKPHKITAILAVIFGEYPD